MTERRRAWKMVGQGGAQLVVGARSALFLPFRDLGLIVVDEEHDTSYKQQEGFRYSARDVAIVRAKMENIPIILGSATPSLESLYNVERGKYAVDRILNRVDDRQLPKIHLIDMRREGHTGKGPSPISRMLADKLIDRFEKKEDRKQC